MTKYRAARGLASDKKGKRWAAGQVLTEKDFPKVVLEFWLREGYIERVEDEQDAPEPEPEPAGEDS